MTPAALRCVIVDDEPLARRRLRRLLEDERDTAVVGECASANEAIALLRHTDADLVFVDVQMPGGDGFQVLKALTNRPQMAFVFVTAYADYAVEAFEAHAVDYLLKPIRPDRLRDAITRVRSTNQRRDTVEVIDRVSAALIKGAVEASGAAPTPTAFPSGPLLVKLGDATHFIQPAEIIWVEASRASVKLHTARGVMSTRGTIAWMEGLLPTTQFARVHRSAIVQVRRVREMRPLMSGDATLILDTGEQVRLSRTFRETFLARMEGIRR